AMQQRDEALREIGGDPGQFLARVAAGRPVDAEAYLRGYAVSKWLPRIGSDETSLQAILRLARILKEQHGESLAATFRRTRCGATTSTRHSLADTPRHLPDGLLPR